MDEREERPILDSAQVDQLNQIEAVDELVQSFIQRLQSWEANVAKALAADDLGQVRELAHALKGTSGNFGAYRLMRSCQALEKAAADSIAQESNRLYEEARIEARQAKNALFQAFPQSVVKGRSSA